MVAMRAGDRPLRRRSHAASDGQESNAEPLTARFETLEHVRPIAAAKIDDAVAETRSVLQLIGKLPSHRGVHLYPDIGVETFELRDLLLEGSAATRQSWKVRSTQLAANRCGPCRRFSDGATPVPISKRTS